MLTEDDRASEENSFKAAEAAMAQLEQERLKTGDDGDEVTLPPEGDPPVTDPPVTDPPVTEDPPVTDPPATDPPATDPPATDPPAGDPPATEPPATEEAVDADAILAELEKIEVTPNAKPNTKRALKAAKESARRLAAGLKAATTREQDAKNELEKAKLLKLLTPEVEEKLQRLEAFQRTFDYQNTDEFRNKYQGRAKALEDKALHVLTDPQLPATSRLPQPTAKFMTETAGGLLNFATSQRPALDKNGKHVYAGGKDLSVDSNGKLLTQEEFYKTHIEPSLTTRQKALVDEAIKNSILLQEEQQNELNEFGAKGEQILAEKQKEKDAKLEQWKKEAQDTAADWLKRHPQYAKKEVPANATAGEKAEIDAHNARFDRAQGIVQRAVMDGSPKMLMEMALSYGEKQTQWPVIMEQKDKENAALKQQVADLTKKLDDIKNAGKTKNLGPAGDSPKPPPAPTKEDPETMMRRQEQEYLQRGAA